MLRKATRTGSDTGASESPKAHFQKNKEMQFEFTFRGTLPKRYFSGMQSINLAWFSF